MEELYPVPPHMNRECAKSWRYEHTVVTKTCIECGREFDQIRRRVAICSEECKAARRARFRPQTFKNCKHCGERFGPVGHLGRQFCSQQCAYDSRVRTKKSVTLPKARSAQNLLVYHIRAGHIVRPTVCEECGCSDRKIEGAHYDYDRPLDVRWLCRSCHAKWDKAEPKGATVSVLIVEKWNALTAPQRQARAAECRATGHAWGELSWGPRVCTRCLTYDAG